MKSILDDKKKGEICNILAVGGTYAMAAARVGFSRRTIYKTANRDPEFRKRIERAKTKPDKTFLKTISRAAAETRYWGAARWALQHMYPDRYARRPLTMRLEDLKDLMSQIMHGIAEVVTDPPTRAAIRRRVRQMTSDAVAKSKKHHRDKAQLAIATSPYDPHWPKDHAAKAPPIAPRT